MTHSFCIKCHVRIHPFVLVVSIKINARKKFLTPRLPPLHIVPTNRFGYHIISDQNFQLSQDWKSKVFNRHSLVTNHVSIAIPMVTENF
jgi:hypothetical protein